MLVALLALLGSATLIGASKWEDLGKYIYETSKVPPDYHVTGEPVSVIIPTYKEEGYLDDTLTAIRNQTYEPIEIVISDASDDESMAATQAIADAYGAKVVHTYYKNVSLGRNLGAEGASSKILIFLDADCIMARDFVEKVVANLNIEGVRLSHGSDSYYDAPLYRDAIRFYGMAFKPKTYTSGRGICMRADDFWAVGGYDVNVDPMEAGQREDLDLGRKVIEMWGVDSLFYDGSAMIAESCRRPFDITTVLSRTSGAIAPWSERGYRKEGAIDGFTIRTGL